MGLLSKVLDNPYVQAGGAADPYGQWQGYGLRNQQLEAGERQAIMEGQAIKENEAKLADAQRLRDRKQRLIPFRALTTDMPGTTDSDGTPLPNLEPVQGQFLLEALKGAKNAKGEPVIQDRGGEAYISEEDYEWGLGIIEKNAGIQTKLAELKSVAIKQKIDTANEEVLKILKKDPNADKPKIVDPQTGLEVDNPAFAEYQKAVANRDNQISYMNKVNQAAKGTLKEGTEAGIGTEKISDTQLYSVLANSKDPAERKRAEDMMKFRRATPEEIGAGTLEKRIAEANTAERIKYNEGIGKALSEIATAAEIERQKISGKGEITPIEKKFEAKGRFTSNLASLGNLYLQLDNMGAIVNIDKDTVSNIWASVKSSTVGQYASKIAGTEEQSFRESIKTIKPLLIQDIRKTTDMGARGMDSEKELEFYLQAATNEKADIQSNIAAIVVLDEIYGEGEIADQLRSLTSEKYIRSIRKNGVDILKGKAKKVTPNATNDLSTLSDDEIKKQLGLP